MLFDIIDLCLSVLVVVLVGGALFRDFLRWKRDITR